MSYKLTAKANDKVNLLLVFMDSRLITTFNKDGEALLTLAPGEHRLHYQINGAGGTVEFDIAGRPKIIVPVHKTWPVSDGVPDGETGTANNIFFEIAS